MTSIDFTMSDPLIRVREVVATGLPPRAIPNGGEIALAAVRDVAS